MLGGKQKSWSSSSTRTGGGARSGCEGYGHYETRDIALLKLAKAARAPYAPVKPLLDAKALTAAGRIWGYLRIGRFARTEKPNVAKL
jgi:hypothetical protein